MCVYVIALLSVFSLWCVKVWGKVTSALDDVTKLCVCASNTLALLFFSYQTSASLEEHIVSLFTVQHKNITKNTEDHRWTNPNGGTASPLNINSSLKDLCGAFHWFVCCCNVSNGWLCWICISLSFSIRPVFWHREVEDEGRWGVGLDHLNYKRS